VFTSLAEIDATYRHNPQIGLTHGSKARLQISRCIDFYAGLFKKSAKKNWSEVRDLAMTFEPTIRKNWPGYLEEMEGHYLDLCSEVYVLS
jgi:hypothetical protein